MSFQNPPVHRNLVAGAHAQPVANLHLFQRDLGLAAIGTDHPRRLGSQVQQGADCTPGAFAGRQFHDLTQQNQGDDDGSGFEIDADAPLRVPEASRKNLGRDQADGAERPGRHHPHRDQAEHVEVAGAERIPAAHQERPAAPQNDGGAKREFQPHGDMFGKEVTCPGKAQDRPHGEHQKRQGQRGADPEPAGEIDQLGVRPLGDTRAAFLLQRHAADRAGPRLRGPHLRVHRAGVDRTGPIGRNLVVTRAPVVGARCRMAFMAVGGRVATGGLFRHKFHIAQGAPPGRSRAHLRMHGAAVNRSSPTGWNLIGADVGGRGGG